MLARASTVQNTNHTGLGLEAYATFTSPLRRREDVIAQKLLLEAVLDIPIRFNISIIDAQLRFANRATTGMDGPAQLLTLQRLVNQSTKGVVKATYLGVCFVAEHLPLLPLIVFCV
jgi:exoribonuclease R